MISTDPNNSISAGTDGALFVEVPEEETTTDVTDLNTATNTNLIGTYNNEDSIPFAIEETVTELDILGGALTYDNEDGSNANVNLISVDPNNAIASGTDGALFVDVAAQETVTDVTDLNTATNTNLIGTYNNEEGDPFEIEETVTELDIAGGELTYDNEDGTNANVNLISADADNGIGVGTDGALFVDIAADETVTSLEQDDTPSTADPTATGEITYTDEDGTTSTAQVVSADPDNNITVGTDGGAFFAGPTICAAGKVSAAGPETAAFNATVSLIDTGDYQITFDNDLGTTDYVIQLTVTDRQGAGNDDPNISYYQQETSGFRVNVGDNDNGSSPRVDFDSEFMFSVICIPGFGNGGTAAGGGNSGGGGATPIGMPATDFTFNNLGDRGSFQLSFNVGNNVGRTWEVLISNRPYATITGLPANVTLTTQDNGDGTYNHLLTGLDPITSVNQGINLNGGNTGGGPGTEFSGTACGCVSFFIN